MNTLGYILRLAGKQEFFSLIADSKVIFVLEKRTNAYKLFPLESDAKGMQDYLLREYGISTEIMFFDKHDIYGENIAPLD
ncbi:MAG TPA: hypothetical protein VIQ31_08745 [Phormidium sp.]